MEFNTLLAISPLDGRYHQKLDALRDIFSEFGLIKFRTYVEVQWLMTLTECAKLPEITPLDAQAKQVLNDLLAHFSLQDAERVKEIEARTNHDVKAVEYFIKGHCQEWPALSHLQEMIHFGCTSEDVNNVAYALMLQRARETCLLPRLNELITQLRTLAHEYAALPMLARTHGQPATPTTLGKEIANVVARLERQLAQLAEVPISAKFNGASGNYNALVTTYPEIDWQQISKQFIEHCHLHWNAYTTQIEPHDTVAEIAAIMMRINTILIDFSRDTWHYIAIQYFQQKAISTEVGSSTMPHKVNPIDFENAEGNLGIANALFGHFAEKLPISRWQRDLSDSTVLRNLGVAFGHAMIAYQALQQGLKKIAPNTEIIAKDLDNHWEVLGEAVQTVMRRYHIEQPYEKLKAFTRGKQMTQALMQDFIQSLDLPQDVKNQLLKLTPANYLGYAADLAKRI